MSKLNDRLVAEADALVSVAERLSRDAATAGSNLGPDRIEELGSVASRGGQLIRKLYGADSQHLVNLTRMCTKSNVHDVALGLVKSSSPLRRTWPKCACSAK